MFGFNSRSPSPPSISSWLVALTLISIPLAGAFGWMKYVGPSFFQSKADSQSDLEIVTRGPFEHIVLEQGEIESSSNNEVKSTIKSRGSSGTPIISVLSEGTLVKKGDQICVLDSSSLEDELKSQRIVVSNAEATVIGADAALRQAEIAMQEYLEGTYLTERKAILSKIALNQQALRSSELSLSSAQRLASKGTLTPLQVEAEKFAVSDAQSTLDVEMGRLSVLDNLTKVKMLVQFDSTIETAKAKLTSVQIALLAEKDQLQEITDQIKACDIRAPADGQIIHANRYGSRSGGVDFVVEPGATVREQQTIILLPDASKMQVKAKVNESRIHLLKEGMPVRIKVGAVTEELNGQIIKVNKYAEPGGMYSSSVKEYAVSVRIINPQPTIRSGMTAEVRIVVEQIPDALRISTNALYETKRHLFVLKKLPNNEWETVEVKIGGSNEEFVMIRQGLNENDAIINNPRTHIDKMRIPEIEEVIDRERLAEIAKMPIDVNSIRVTHGNGSSEGGSPGGGSRGGGPGGGSRSGDSGGGSRSGSGGSRP